MIGLKVIFQSESQVSLWRNEWARDERDQFSYGDKLWSTDFLSVSASRRQKTQTVKIERVVRGVENLENCAIQIGVKNQLKLSKCQSFIVTDRKTKLKDETKRFGL